MLNPLVSASLLVKLKSILEAGILYGGFALLGGISRVILGLEEGETLKGALLRYLFAALPVGILAGWGTEGLTPYEFFPYAAAYIAGTTSYNVVLYTSKHSFNDLIKLIKSYKREK